MGDGGSVLPVAIEGLGLDETRRILLAPAGETLEHRRRFLGGRRGSRLRFRGHAGREGFRCEPQRLLDLSGQRPLSTLHEVVGMVEDGPVAADDEGLWKCSADSEVSAQ